MKPFKSLLTRRNFIGGGCAALAAGAYMRLAEGEWLEINERTISLPPSAGAAPIRLLHLSDFHASPAVRLEYIAESIQLGLDLKPDFICLTGDYITWQFEEFTRYGEILKRLSNSAPTFATLGNHDGGLWAGRSRGYKTWKKVSTMLLGAGITLLHNQTTHLELKGRTLQMVGVGDLWARQCNPAVAFKDAKANEFTILLSHNPDSKQMVQPFPWNLMLCGHTHGGQLRIPFIGTPFAPVRDKKFVQGLHRWDNRWIHITKGIGSLHGLRVNCRPEISLLNLA